MGRGLADSIADCGVFFAGAGGKVLRGLTEGAGVTKAMIGTTWGIYLKGI